MSSLQLHHQPFSRILSKVFPLCLEGRVFCKTSSVASRTFSASPGNKDSAPCHPNLNEHITRLLEKKALFHLNTKAEDPSHFKYIGYSNAVLSLKKWPKKLKSRKDAQEVTRVGTRLSKKINEIIETGRLRSVDDRRLEAVGDLLRVTGIAYNDAKYLYRKGITSIDSLRKSTRFLSREQAKALEYLEYLEMEIPRDEAKNIEEFVRSILHDRVDSKLTVQAVYRRNMPVVGIDFLITHPDFSIPGRKESDRKGPRHVFLETIVDSLKKAHIIKEDFAPTEMYKFVGLFQPWDKGMARLTRLHLVTKDEYIFARLSLTETPQTVRKMKEKALHMGYIIKDYGLNKPKFLGGTPILVQSEEEIFRVLQSKPSPRFTIPPLPLEDCTSGEVEMVD